MMWAALRVISGREASVIEWIKVYGDGESYCPMKTIWRKVRSRRAAEIGKGRERVQRPYFPGYIFTTSQRRPPRTSFVLGSNQKVLPMPESEIGRLRKAQDSGEFDETAAAKLAALLGMEVEFTSGPLVGRHALVTALLNGGNDVALDLAGRIELRLPLAKFQQISVRAQLSRV